MREQTEQSVRQPSRPQQQQNRPKVDMSKLQASRMQAAARQGRATRGSSPVHVEKKVGRNEPCPCGSGKKYKKCHLDFDERLEELAETGEEVPPRDLLKTPAEIEGIKRSAEVNVGVLDYVAERITPALPLSRLTSGCTTTPWSTAPFPRRSIMRASRSQCAPRSTRWSATVFPVKMRYWKRGILSM